MKIKLNNQLKDEVQYKWVIWIDDTFSKEDLNSAKDFGLTVGRENWYKPDMKYIIGTAQQIVDFCKATNPDEYGNVTVEEIEEASHKPMSAIHKINDSKKVKDSLTNEEATKLIKSKVKKADDPRTVVKFYKKLNNGNDLYIWGIPGGKNVYASEVKNNSIVVSSGSYDVSPDLLKDVVKDSFEANIKKLIKEEEEAIASYEHEIENAQNPNVDKLLRHIQAEEQEHLRELKSALKGEFNDSKKVKDATLTVGRLRHILENALEQIENLADNTPVNTQSNTYRIGVPFIGTYDGYIDLNNIIDEEEIEDMLVQWIYDHYKTREDALNHIREIENNSPVPYDYDIEDLINEMPDFEDSINDSVENKKFDVAYLYTEDYKNSKLYNEVTIIEAKDEKEAKEKLEELLDKKNRILKKIVLIEELK